MGYRIAADLLLVLHLAFIAFVLFGGLLAWWRGWFAMLHLPAAAWGVLLELNGWGCPLTPWEQQLRIAAGEAGYTGGFIVHYLVPLIYPAGLERNLQAVLAGIVIVVNVLVYGGWWWRRRRWARKCRFAMPDSIGPLIRCRWRALSKYPGGRWLFSRGLGSVVPYTGTLRARVMLLEPGHCRVMLRDRRRLRNHLRSVHAMALANLAELATGLALIAGLPEHTRAILVGFHIEYVKKARGTLLAECRCAPPPDNTECDCAISGEIRDAGGDVVATARAVWRTGPVA